jgi:hypothetical protein
VFCEDVSGLKELCNLKGWEPKAPLLLLSDGGGNAVSVVDLNAPPLPNGLAVFAVPDAAPKGLAVFVAEDAAPKGLALFVVEDAAPKGLAVFVVEEAAPKGLAVFVVEDAAPKGLAPCDEDAAPNGLPDCGAEDGAPKTLGPPPPTDENPPLLANPAKPPDVEGAEESVFGATLPNEV